MTQTPASPFQAVVSLPELESLSADLPDSFPSVEMLRDGEQLAYLLALRRLFDSEGLRPRGIIHVGANVGEELGLYLLLGIPRMLFIEANSAAIPELLGNVAALNKLALHSEKSLGFSSMKGGAAQASAVHCAIGAETGTTVLNVMAVPTLSSLLPANIDPQREEAPDFAVTGRTQVAMRRLEDVVATLPHGWLPEDFNILRLNIQGSELMALSGAAGWLSHCDLIFTEVNIVERYSGCPRLEDLDAFLATHGFTRRWGYQWDPSGGDAVYVRPPR